jgi:NCS2 family nucleobase:cation symporter-2
MSVSPSAVGVSEATGATSRAIAFAVGAWYVFLALMPKLAACFLALPEAVVGGALTFTGSLLLATGVRIVAANHIDTRRSLVIGVSLLLGLSREAFPAFYHALPPAWGYVTNSTLSITTLAAILLNALFRIGLRKSAETAITLDRSGLDALAAQMQTQGKRWGVAADVLEEAMRAARGLVQAVEDHHLADGPIDARVSFDEISYRVDLRYRGHPLALPARRHRWGSGHEESPAAEGLAAYLADVHPDQVHTSMHGQTCEIRLVFLA